MNKAFQEKIRNLKINKTDIRNVKSSILEGEFLSTISCPWYELERRKCWICATAFPKIVPKDLEKDVLKLGPDDRQDCPCLVEDDERKRIYEVSYVLKIMRMFVKIHEEKLRK